ncbi:threonine synthase [Acanthopleuribacter pedis]|uniref:Threonine synthase n=1 Tax=Acanthopleuribacter pedis TaxID=442870 RepID=A0A8J7QHQ0_9BACT|nr:threonine synthase [Acanthopleuribacter pedis]MBO1320741.1 threonine synthase [Acanthopleuribacter pedis]
MAGLIERYREFLPVSDATPIISLEEGNTPLIPAPHLSKLTGARVFLKYEGANPTGSFKDRGMTMAVSKAVEDGAKAVICASTGNTSAAAAAYAARAGIKCIVLIPEGKVALGKLSQVALSGADILQINGNFDECLNMVRYLSENYPVALVNSVNPYRIEGQKTGAFEIVDQLGYTPTYQAMPVGNAGNITAYWAGYKAYHAAGKAERLPTMLGFQAAGAAPIVNGQVVEAPETVATAIRIGNPASWKQAEAARDESGGLIQAIEDEALLEAYHLLSSKEGVFCEPASAIGVAGILRLAKQNFFKEGDSVVCILTGNGLKDPQTAMTFSEEVQVLAADGPAVAEHLGFVAVG